MPWTYLVECADRSFYVGSTVDLDRRLAEHQNGEGAAYTRRPGRRPVRLLWAAEFARIDGAFAYEKRVQGWGRAKRLALIEGRLDDLPALASRAWRHRNGRGFETVAAQPPQPPSTPTTGG
ncbi:GIY-YIG nuclease family protein [Nocardioides lianchengensis]|uniref:GIY-YIG nuclease family protein n=1 Tax=Nocardioides lianchengensis TaxID=1045774 RepID=UPI000B84428B|nr:GIY-YIG nuclease family protein [Nocardioides lianchengensis]NYG08792.1 putative endonuclease [Nocardioides lianchengensis]